MMEVESRLSRSAQILLKLEQTAAGVESQQRNLREQIQAFSQEGAQAAKELEAANALVHRLTARLEVMNNGRAECARTATQADFAALVIADIRDGSTAGRLCGQLPVESSTLGQGGSDPHLMTQALDSLMETLNARGVPVSISQRVSESTSHGDKVYQVEWAIKAD